MNTSQVRYQAKTKTAKTRVRGLLASARKTLLLLLFVLILSIATIFSGQFLDSTSGRLDIRPTKAYAFTPPLITIPYKVNFQARLTDQNGNILPNGSYNIKFSLWTAATGGTNVWEEDYLDSNSQGVTITNGLFSVQLGSITALSPTLFSSNPNLYLQIELPSPATATSTSPSWTEGPMSPRQPLASSPYAFNADTLDGIDSTQFARTDQGNTFTGANSFNGNVSITGTNTLTVGGATSLQGTTIAGATTLQGSVTIGTTSSLGKLSFLDGTTDGFTGILQPTTLTGNQTYTLPNASGTVALTNDTTNFIRNQTSQQASSNFNISGTGIAGALQAGSLDTSSAAALNIGTTNANAITVGSTNTTTTVQGNLNANQSILINGTYTTANNYREYISGTLNSSVTTNQYGLQNQVNFNPSGASLTNIFGTVSTPVVSGSSLNISSLYAFTGSTQTTAGYTGTISNAAVYNAQDASIAGSKLFSNFAQFQGGTISANSGNTSGTINNYNVKLNGSTAAAGTGGTLNNYGIYLTQPSGSGGTTNNYGLYIQGNGAGSANYSIYNNSTALSYYAGSINSVGGYQYNGTTGATTTCSGGQFLQNQVVQGGIVTGGTCASAAAGLTGSGTSGTIAMFSGSSTNLANSILTQSGTTISVGGSLSATGNIVFSGSPAAGTTSSLIQIGNVLQSGASDGTYISINVPSGGTAASADLLNFEANGSSTFKVDAGGSITANSGNFAGTVSVFGISSTTTIDAGSGFKYNGTAGSTVSCTGGQLLQNQVVQGGITTGGSCVAAGTGGITTIGTLDTSGEDTSANGATISGSTLYLQSATGSVPGLVSTGVQTFAGAKTFNSSVTLNNGPVINGGVTISGSSSTSGDFNFGSTIEVQSTAALYGATNLYGLASFSNVGGKAIVVSTTPTASATQSVIQLGSAIQGGNSTTNGGTYIGLNAPSSGAGSVADFLNFQNAGTSVVRIDSLGNIYDLGGISANSAQFNNTVEASGFVYNSTAGATTTCSGGQFLQNQVVQGGIVTGGTCASAAAGLTGSGTVGTIAMFSGSSTNLANSILSQSGTSSIILTPGSGNPTIQSSSGTLLLGTGTSTTTVQGYLNVTGGVSGYPALTVSGTPGASATASQIQIGNAIQGGNSATNGGTYIGLNAPSSGAGSAADFLNFQTNGITSFKLDNAGDLTLGPATSSGSTSTSSSLTFNNYVQTAGLNQTTLRPVSGQPDLLEIYGFSGNSQLQFGMWPGSSNVGYIRSPATGNLVIGNSGDMTSIGKGAMASYTLDVGGDINTSGYYRQAGNIVVNTTTGTENTYVGVTGISTSSGGGGNVATGWQALNGISSGTDNVAVGIGAAHNNTTGSGNVAIGGLTLQNNTTGSNNTAIGQNAGTTDVQGHFSTAATLQNATAIGAYAQVQKNNTIVLGSVDNATQVVVGATVPVGTNSFGVSPVDLNSNTITASQSNGSGTITASAAIFSSSNVGEELVWADGTTETITGYTSSTVVTGSSTTITETNSYFRTHHIGLQVSNTGLVGFGTANPQYAVDATGDINTSGYYRQAGQIVINTTTGTNNTLIGPNAGSLVYGTGSSYSVALGANTLAVTNGNYNTAIGYGALQSLHLGSQNTALGYNAGSGGAASCSTGMCNFTGNTLLGYEAGYGLQTGANYNTLLGNNAGSNLTTGTQNIIIGYNIQAPSNTGSNQLNIGNTIYGNLSAGTAYIMAGSTSAFQVQNAGGTAMLNVDTTNGIVTIGTGANTITLSTSGGYSATGTARHTKTIALAPEYANTVLDSASDSTCSSANSGVMASGLDTSAGIGNGSQSYYEWTTTSATSQCYDVVVQVPIPSDFGGFVGNNIGINTYSSSTSTATIYAKVVNTAGGVDVNYTNITPATASVWSAQTVSGLTGTYTPGGFMTLYLRLSSTSSSIAKLGNITFSYYSTF